ncbi:MAG: hypothetical protein Q8O67_32975 [Deltaproteobacteria bacterium]|nr:hypothetical protein [Deltaproteobacteria bacterium]
MKLLIVVGVIVLLAGVSLILNAFQIHLPLFRIALGALLGWLGLSLVLSGFGVDQGWLAFGHQRAMTKMTTTIDRQDVFFSNREFDLTGIKPGEHMKIGLIFGEATVRYDPRTPIELRSSTAFGSTDFPDGSKISFGERTLLTAGAGEGTPAAIVDVSTVFGTTRFVPVSP